MHGPQVDHLIALLDALLVVSASACVLMAIAGLACVEVGLTRAKNASSAMVKAILVTGVALASFHLLAQGDAWYQHFRHQVELYDAAMAAWVAVSIATALSERCKLTGLLIVAGIVAGPLYVKLLLPAMLTMGGFNGFGLSLAPGLEILAAVGALAGAIAVGPRLGKYNRDGSPNPLPGHNLPMALLGLFFVWIGWFGVNLCGAMVVTPEASVLCHVVLNTSLSGLAGCLATALMSHMLWREVDIALLLCGGIGGLAASSLGSNWMASEAAILVGGIAGAVAAGASLFVERKGIDDPIGIVSSYGVGGCVGVLSVLLGPLLSKYPLSDPWYEFVRLPVQILLIALPSFFLMWLVFYLLNKLNLLRVSPADELQGLDLSTHGGSAYPQG